MKEIAIIKDTNNLYYFEVFKRTESTYKSDTVYSNVFILDNAFETYHQCDLLLLTKNNKSGIFDAWENKFIIPIEYDDIDVVEHYLRLVFICKINNQYYFYDINGNKIFPNKYDDYIYVGDYQNEYIYLLQKDEEVGAFTINGHEIIKLNEDYLLEYYRLENYIVLKKTNGNYDIFNYTGVKIYNDCTNYEMLGV